MADAGARRLELAPRASQGPISGDSRRSALELGIAGVRLGRRALAVAATLLVAAGLVEARSTYDAALGAGDEQRVEYAVFETLYHLWAHLAVVLAAIGLAAWVGVVMQSILTRRLRRPERNW